MLVGVLAGLVVICFVAFYNGARFIPGLWDGRALTPTHQAPGSQNPGPSADTGVVATDIAVAGSTFTVVSLDLQRADLRLFWKQPGGTRFANFKNLASGLEATGEHLLFATNAGIFEPGYIPLGLHVEEGRQYVPLNLKDGAGNFYIKPNGVFLIDGAGARIIDAATFGGTTPDLRLATQSGPLLAIAGEINPRFSAASSSRRLRSGVGVVTARQVCFVISHEPVTFRELATLFLDRLNCRNAMYLDGVISRFYLPRNQTDDGDFAGILGAVSRTAAAPIPL